MDVVAVAPVDRVIVGATVNGVRSAITVEDILKVVARYRVIARTTAGVLDVNAFGNCERIPVI